MSLPSHEGTLECFIDAGLSPKQTGERLRLRNLLPIKPRVLILTHADSDHWRPTWAPHVERLHIRVLARREHHAALLEAGMPQRHLEVLPTGTAMELAPGVTLHALPTPHDEHGSTALRFESSAGRFAWLTDLGRAEPEVIDFAKDCEVVGIESNYCPDMQMASRRPLFLKQRIMGGRGHLSNEQCLSAVEAMVACRQTVQPHRFVLLHLSRDCNSPSRIRDLWRQRVPGLLDHVVITSQTIPTPVMSMASPARYDCIVP
ncbi:MAG: MBL fold metallo-hydrolase [Phycisphaeraceae bacterium]|nr:MBL fold metallo-hydrolase [Phycisphaeraceae bacterium]